MDQAQQTSAECLDIDACVRKVTAASSFADLKDTQPSYAPKFYPGRSSTREDIALMVRVTQAWNAWAKREGRPMAFVQGVTA